MCTRHMTSFLTKNAQKRCCGNFNIWPNWFTSHQSQYCLYYNGIPEFVRKCSMLTVNSWNNAKYSKKFHCREVHSTRIGKLWRLSGRFQTLIWRPGEIWRSATGRYMWWQPLKNVTTRLIIVEWNSSRPYFSHFFLGCCLQRYSKWVSF